jgi:hypothetical protein
MVTSNVLKKGDLTHAFGTLDIAAFMHLLGCRVGLLANPAWLPRDSDQSGASTTGDVRAVVGLP